MDKPSDRPNLQRHKCCLGALYYSQSLMDRGMPPICGGLRQRHKASEDLAQLQTEAANMVDFKYVCVGYSMYDEDRITQQPERDGPTGGEIDLPYCEGIEVVSSRQLQQTPVLLKEGANGTDTSSNGEDSPPRKKAGMFTGSNAPNFVPEPGKIDWTKFPERFERSADLIVQKMGQNASYLLSSLKKILERLDRE